MNHNGMKGVREVTQASLLNEYEKVVKTVLVTLAENPEWKRRYHKYCLDESAISSIRKMRKAFRVRAPIYSYLSISKQSIHTSNNQFIPATQFSSTAQFMPANIFIAFFTFSFIVSRAVIEIWEKKIGSSAVNPFK